jgi:hypothetical protein
MVSILTKIVIDWGPILLYCHFENKYLHEESRVKYHPHYIPTGVIKSPRKLVAHIYRESIVSACWRIHILTLLLHLPVIRSIKLLTSPILSDLKLCILLYFMLFLGQCEFGGKFLLHLPSNPLHQTLNFPQYFLIWNCEFYWIFRYFLGQCEFGGKLLLHLPSNPLYQTLNFP